MKLRLTAIIIMCMTIFTVATAQTHYKPHISLGGRAGLSMAEISFSPSVKQSWNMGSTGAVTFRYTEEKLFGLVAELGWVTRGWAENYEGEPFSYSRSLTYLNIPFLTQIYFGSPRCKAFINLGPQFAFLLGSKISSDFDYKNVTSISTYPSTRETEQLNMDISNRFDYGICAGLGCEFWITPSQSILAEARFYYGLGNIFPSAKADYFNASRCMSIEVALGYNFRIR